MEEILGPGVALEEADDVEPLRDYLRREASLNPKSFPDGVQPGDVFIRYPHGDESTTLQFRNGFLVNHDPTLFAGSEPGVSIQGRDEVTRVSREGRVIQVKAGD